MRGIEVSTYLFTRHAAKPYHRMCDRNRFHTLSARLEVQLPASV
jgi:hypothetical protein